MEDMIFHLITSKSQEIENIKQSLHDESVYNQQDMNRHIDILTGEVRAYKHIYGMTTQVVKKGKSVPPVTLKVQD